MNEHDWQGLFYLTAGFLSFFSLGVLFRVLSSRNAESSEVQADDTRWLGLEELEIVDIVDESHDIKSFVLRRTNGKNMPKYDPGQFLSFRIGNDDKVFRSYSISDSTENQNVIQVSIKKIPDGVGSNWFHSKKIGDKVFSHPPGGHFTNSGITSERQVFIAGGIGITPFLSMASSARDMISNKEMILFYGAKTLPDLAFHDDLLLLSKRFKNFTYVPVLSKESPEGWLGEKGRINADLLKKHIGSFDNAKFLFCGPSPLIDSLSASLIENGVTKAHILSEKFVSPTTISLDDIPFRKVSVEFDGTKYDYEGKENLLDYLENQGAQIPFACRSGVCGACKVKVKNGKCTSLTDSGLSEEDKKDYILTCVSWPDSELQISS